MSEGKGVERVVRGRVMEALSAQEKRQLQADEAIIAQGRGMFQAVGEALADIRDNRLYRETHETFQSYCNDRWDLATSRAYQQIWAVEAIRYIVQNDPDAEVPANERVARELGSLMRQDRGEGGKLMLEAWGRAREEAGEDPPTTEIVRGAVRAVRYLHSPYYAENGEADDGRRLSMPGDMFRDVTTWLRASRRKLDKIPLPDQRGLAQLEVGWRKRVLEDVDSLVATLTHWQSELGRSDAMDAPEAPARRRGASRR